MAIEVISEIVPKNAQDFVIVDANRIRGGFYQVNTIAERDSIPKDHFKEGSMIYVKEDSAHTYQWISGKWTIAKVGYNTAVVVDTEDELTNEMGQSLGQIAYVKETNTILVYGQYGWSHLETVVVSFDEPTDTNVIWIDPSGDTELNQEGNLTIVREELKSLQTQVNQLLKILNYGAIAGSSSVGGRTRMMTTAEPIDPNTRPDPDYIPSIIEPDKDQLECTVPNISIKFDTLANFKKNTQNLIDGELVWITDKKTLYIYLNGIFIPTSNGSGTEEGGDDMTQEDIEKLYFNHLGFVDSKENQYKLSVDEHGTIQVYNTANYDKNIGAQDEKTGSYISNYLKINSFYIGGTDTTTLDKFPAATHNFVELAYSDTLGPRINLNGIYLLYRENNSASWESVALRGFIEPGSTFLIRGAQCGYPSNITIDVDDYDLQWYDSKGNLIKFNDEGGTFYLVVSQNGLFHNTKEWVTLPEIGTFDPFNPEDVSKLPIGYIDLVGYVVSKEGSAPTIHAEGNAAVTIKDYENIKRSIFLKSMTLDPCTQAQQKTLDKRNNAKGFTYIKLDEIGTDEFPYYPNELKERLVPKASKYHKNIFGTRSIFNKYKPNAVNITFGIQATASPELGATRCFNWVSVGYYDEFLEFKNSDESSFHRLESITEKNISTQYKSDPLLMYNGEPRILGTGIKAVDLYKRIRWVTTNNTGVTTHKVILRGLKAGKYIYRIGRIGDPNYKSDEYTFTVRNTSDCDNFSFIQTTDQQAFNYMEYQAWSKACWAINENHPDIHFTVNTGDMTQNGNRESEWIDYFEGRKYLRSKEEMTTIGNNDLCGIVPYALGTGDAGTYKINHKNFDLYFTYEIDYENAPIFSFKCNVAEHPSFVGDVLYYTDDTIYFKMPSLYSFNYGKYHFICLNSEFAPNTYNVYYSDSAIAGDFKANVYYSMYKWMEKDVSKYEMAPKIAYMHEIPISITKNNSKGIAVERAETGGSKLNEDFSNVISDEAEKAKHVGGCSFSTFFEDHNIKLAFGGHKHTYSLTYPLKENVSLDGKRSIKYNEPLRDDSKGVVYAMCQATGYKLVSNKEMPGIGIKWLQKYYEVIANTVGEVTTVTANPNQFYPMYSLYEIAESPEQTESNVKFTSYRVDNIYKIVNSKPINFNINSQEPEFISKNSEPIDLNGDVIIKYKL